MTLKDPVRVVSAEAMLWASYLDVLHVGRSPLPGGWEKRTFTQDPRFEVKPMIIGGQSVGPKDSDIVVYYDQVALLEHRKTHHVFVVFQETLAALMAGQRDPVKFPKWIWDCGIKQSERTYRYAVMTKPPANVSWFTDWLTGVEEAFSPEDAELVHSALTWYLIKKKVIEEITISARPR